MGYFHKKVVRKTEHQSCDKSQKSQLRAWIMLTFGQNIQDATVAKKSATRKKARKKAFLSATFATF